jgi:hypothetical protein
MKDKKFPFKVEELVPVTESLLNSANKDLNDFSNYSSVFTTDYLSSIRSKSNACKDVTSSSTLTKELKFVTQQLYDKSKNLRVKINALEGYLELGVDGLDIMIEDVGLKNVRSNIANKNTEGLVLNMQKMLTVVKRNRSALEAKGMKPELIGEIESQIQKIEALNVKQNDMTSDRNRLTKQNISQYNDLWDNLQPILKTAKAIYRGVDDVKLKDYTIRQLRKRINAEGKKNVERNESPAE